MLISCQLSRKIGGFGPLIFRGGDIPYFGHTFSNRTHFRACGRFWLSSVQRARRVADVKRQKKEEDRIAVKLNPPTTMSGSLKSVTHAKQIMCATTLMFYSAYLKNSLTWFLFVFRHALFLERITHVLCSAKLPCFAMA